MTAPTPPAAQWAAAVAPVHGNTLVLIDASPSRRVAEVQNDIEQARALTQPGRQVWVWLQSEGRALYPSGPEPLTAQSQPLGRPTPAPDLAGRAQLSRWNGLISEALTHPALARAQIQTLVCTRDTTGPCDMTPVGVDRCIVVAHAGVPAGLVQAFANGAPGIEVYTAQGAQVTPATRPRAPRARVA